MIAQQDFLPKYYQISSEIIEMIRTGYRKPGARIPPENDIIWDYNVSKTTARKVLQEIELDRERKKAFSAILAGDVVSRKKPDPEIYLLCQQRLKVNPAQCVVVEDNRNRLLAAKAAGMFCVVTTNPYTASEDFTGADILVDQLGDEDKIKVSLHDLMNLTA